jgi:hypothetical protein
VTRKRDVEEEDVEEPDVKWEEPDVKRWKEEDEEKEEGEGR